MKTQDSESEPATAVDLHRLVRRLRCAIIGHLVYPCDHSGASLMRCTDEGVEAECAHCGKTIRATCGLELCGLVWCRKPLELLPPQGVFGGWRCTLSDPPDSWRLVAWCFGSNAYGAGYYDTKTQSWARYGDGNRKCVGKWWADFPSPPNAKLDARTLKTCSRSQSEEAVGGAETGFAQ